MSAGKATRVIDLHAHALLEAAFNQAGAYGPEPGVEDGVPFFRIGSYRMKPMSYRGTVFTDVDAAMRELDRAAVPASGVDRRRLEPGAARRLAPDRG